MSSNPVRDTTTLKNISKRKRDSLLLVDPSPQKSITEPVQPSAVIERLCSFIPKIAAANNSLMHGEFDSAMKLDIDIHKVEDTSSSDESDTSSSDEYDTSDDDMDDEKKSDQKVEFDLALFREQETPESAVALRDSLVRQEVELLPEAFREDESTICHVQDTKRSKKLIEEL
uniref:Uncharacterized protein n=1 Tax=Haemonchus contortus TaxID=6289 RepID=A0A7I4YMQ1_HAECO